MVGAIICIVVLSHPAAATLVSPYNVASVSSVMVSVYRSLHNLNYAS